MIIVESLRHMTDCDVPTAVLLPIVIATVLIGGGISTFLRYRSRWSWFRAAIAGLISFGVLAAVLYPVRCENVRIEFPSLTLALVRPQWGQC